MSETDEFDPAAVLAEDDRIRAEAEAEQQASRSSELCYRRQENARRAAAAPILDGGEHTVSDVCEVREYDDNTIASLLEAISMVRAHDLQQWDAIEGALLDKLNELQREVKTLTASYQSVESRVTDIERQIATLVAKRVAGVEKRTSLLIRASSDKTARINKLEDKVKGLSEASAGEPSSRDLDGRLAYIEALMATMFPMPSRLRA